MTPEAFERIETKLAYLEHANSELSDVVFRQAQEIETLRAQLAALLSRMDSRQPEERPYSLEEEKPPHY